MDWAQTTSRRDENHLSFGIWCVLYRDFAVLFMWPWTSNSWSMGHNVRDNVEDRDQHPAFRWTWILYIRHCPCEQTNLPVTKKPMASWPDFSLTLFRSGARPTNSISMEFDIRPKFRVLLFKRFSTDCKEILQTSRQLYCPDVCKILLCLATKLRQSLYLVLLLVDTV